MLQRIGIGIGMTAVACALLVAPAGAKSGHGEAKKAAVQACKQDRQANPAAFAEKYGRQTMRNCTRETLAATVTELRNAAQECRAEREEMGVEAFRLEYGNNHNGRNAFGKCVSEKVHEEPAPEVVEGDGTTGDGTGTGDGTTGDTGTDPTADTGTDPTDPPPA